MEAEKFTNEDRHLIVKELEKIQKLKFTAINSSRKLIKDENGMIYFLFGGIGDWHGISPTDIIELNAYKKEGVFVVAKKYKSKIDLFVGSLNLLLKNKTKLIATKKGGLQFHTVLNKDLMHLKEIPKLSLKKIGEIITTGINKGVSRLDEISKLINTEVNSNSELTHSDIQAKLILIGNYLGFKTYTPDRSKKSIYGILGDLCSENVLPERSFSPKDATIVKYIDVMWFDDEEFPTHGFEVEHSTDITKGLLRLYQIHKLKIKMFIIGGETSKEKFNKEIHKNPFYKIKQEFIFKNYSELDEFFESVKSSTKIQQKFFNIVN